MKEEIHDRACCLSEVPVRCWINREPIRIVYRDIGGLHGLWVYGGMTIFLNAKDCPAVQAATLAHEVSHGIFEQSYDGDATLDGEDCAIFSELLWRGFYADERNEKVIAWMRSARTAEHYPDPDLLLSDPVLFPSDSELPESRRSRHVVGK